MEPELEGLRALVLDRDGAPLAASLRSSGAAVSETTGPFGFDARPAAAVRSARERLGGLEAIVTVVPWVELEPLADLSPARWKERFRRLVEEPFVLVQAWLRDVLAHAVPGCWIAVTSHLGTQPFPSGGSVGAATAALHTLVRVAAVEYGPRGVRANAVAVGWQEGSVPEALGRDGAARAVEDTPSGRLASSADVVGAVAWLLSRNAAHVNGEVLRVDGGYTVTRSAHVAPSQAVEKWLLDDRWRGATERSG